MTADHREMSNKEKGTARMDSSFFTQKRSIHMELEERPNGSMLSGSASFVKARRISSAAVGGFRPRPAGIAYETPMPRRPIDSLTL